MKKLGEAVSELSEDKQAKLQDIIKALVDCFAEGAQGAFIEQAHELKEHAYDLKEHALDLRDQAAGFKDQAHEMFTDLSFDRLGRLIADELDRINKRNT